MGKHEGGAMVARPQLSGLLELVAAVSIRIAAYQETLEAGISNGVSGETRDGRQWLAHVSTRPGELYRVTMFSGGVPTGHISFGGLREMAAHLVGIASCGET